MNGEYSGVDNGGVVRVFNKGRSCYALCQIHNSDEPHYWLHSPSSTIIHSLVMLVSHDDCEYEIKFESGKAATNILQQQLSPLRHVRADNQCDDVRVHTDQSASTSIQRHVRCCRASNIQQIHPECRQFRTARLPKRSHLYGWCWLRNADHMTKHCLHYIVSQNGMTKFSDK
ncbi:hypothetical protein CBL_02076 [Carabus blaptoides fortunei]